MPDLLSRGFFPKELPPCFDSEALANAFANTQLSQEKDSVCESTAITLPQANGSRRTLTIPNPKGHLHLVKSINTHWNSIDAILAQTKVSRSRLIVDQATRNLVLNSSDLPAERLNARRMGRFLLRLDINDFYRSIYTHALPWAIHGRATAKVNRNRALFGNELDQLTGLASSKETHGLPVGPITSLVLAELLLAPIDEFIEHRLRPTSAHRYFDDFELVFENESEAAIALEKIEAELTLYRLGVNPLKTKIDRLPVPIERAWLRQVRQFRFTRNRRGTISTTSLDDFFDNAVEIARQEVGDRVLPYAIGRIQKEIPRARGTWSRIEKFLLHFLFAAPEVAPIVVSTFVQAQRQGLGIDRAALESGLNHVAFMGAARSPSIEVLWALWGLGTFRLSLASNTANAVASSSNSVAKLLSRYLQTLLTKTKPTQFGIGSNPWSTDEWLLAHESRRRGFKRKLPSDPFFDQLKTVELLTDIQEVEKDEDLHEPVFEGHNEGSAQDGDGDYEPDDEDEDDPSDI